MSRMPEYTFPLAAILIVALAITASGFYRNRVNSVPLPADKASLARWPYDNSALPEGIVPSSFPPMPPPVAYFSPSTESTFKDAEVTFDASISYDPLGQVASYKWDFGDGSEGKGEVATHSYSSSGEYDVKLTVTGALGASSSFSKQIAIKQGVKGDVNNDGQINSSDATLTLRIVAGLAVPTEYEKWASDVNGDGETGVDDVILVLRKATGLAAPVKNIIVNTGTQPNVALANISGIAGENVTMSLKVDDGHNVAGGQIFITYDPEVLRVVDVSSEAGVLLASSNVDPGIVRITFASTGRLLKQEIASLEFYIMADGMSPLNIQRVQLYDPNAHPLSSKITDGEFRSWTMAPERNALLQNFPNPFNPETWIPYQLKEDREVTVQIYSTAGNLVRQLHIGYKQAGLYVNRDRAAYWDGKNSAGETVASGVYFYSIRAGDFYTTRKMTVLR